MSMDYKTLILAEELREAFKDYEYAIDVEKYVRSAKPAEFAKQRTHTAFTGIRLAIELLKQYGYGIDDTNPLPAMTNGVPRLPEYLLFKRSA